eukprot:TRINITY_DN20493_c0_g1_i3.p1 TRINITY_DN20493_c0_g1~~TRINITY_DN20493_c0_g1_i3.p1  ORF type:complete len:201 (+),score=59.42 TRINITY_DN20493_c0_g1_i3:107-709(+)
MIRRPPRSTLSSSSAASDVYKRQSQLAARRLDYSSVPEGQFLDQLVLDYLRFRGFTNTMAQFEQERKLRGEVTRRVQVSVIVERLLQHVGNGEFDLLVALWHAVACWLLGGACGDICLDMETDLWRYSMVSAIREGRWAQLRRLLTDHGHTFPTNHDWSDWYVVNSSVNPRAVSYTHLRAHETPEHLVCRLLLEKKKKKS